MSPTNLGALPGVEPAPTGLTQVKRGVASTTLTWNNTVTFGTPLQDGAGGNMVISLTTPNRRGWWVIHGQTMWLQVEAVWMSFEVWVSLSVSDLNGWSTFKSQHCMHPAVGWTSLSHDCAFLLEANSYYACYLIWGYSAGYNQTYHCHPAYHFIEGEFIAEGGV